MKEQLALLMIVVCAAMALAADHDGAEDATAALPAVSSPGPGRTAAEPRDDASDLTPIALRAPAEILAEADMVSQILDRFAVRHTALPDRERLRLAHVIVEEARAHDLSPDLVMAVIEVESAGYHLAESHVGALGLMQLLPATGRELAGKLGIPWKGPDTLFDPVINVRLGTAYLRELADRYDGEIDIALAAYNWGPGRIDRRLRRGARVPSIYIEQVRRAVDRYAALPAARS